LTAAAAVKIIPFCSTFHRHISIEKGVVILGPNGHDAIGEDMDVFVIATVRAKRTSPDGE